MGILDDLITTDKKTQKKSGILDDLIEPVKEAKANISSTSFRDNPSAGEISFKNPLPTPKEDFLSGFTPTPTKPVPQGPEMVRQYDGKMVPKSEARNSYGGLIYGNTIGGEKTISEGEYLSQKIQDNPSLSNIREGYKFIGKNAVEKIQNIPEKIQNFGENLYSDKPFMTLDDILKESYKPKLGESDTFMGNVRNAPENFKQMGSLIVNTIKYGVDKVPTRFSTENPQIFDSNQEYANNISVEKRKKAFEEGLNNQEQPNPIVEEFIKNNPIAGDFYKSLKQTGRQMSESSMNFVGSTLRGVDIEVVQKISEWADNTANFYVKSRVSNSWENPDKDMKSFLDGGYQDPRFYTRGIGQVLPQFLMAIGLTVATKKPQVGLGFGYTQEAGQAYGDLVDRGVNPEDAKQGALAYGTIATILEGVNFTKYSNKVLGNSVSREAKETWKQAVKETLIEGGIDILKEGATEGAQQFSQNVMTRFYDKNQDLFEGVIDSAVIGALGGAGYTGIGMISDANISEATKKTYYDLKNNISKARDIILGKVPPANQEESIIAEQIVNKYDQKIKETALVIYDPGRNNMFAPDKTPAITIDTVKYDDDTYRSSIEVNNDGNIDIAPFSQVYKSKKEAIQGAITQAKTLTESPEITKQLDRPLEELLRVKEDIMPWDEGAFFTPSELQTLENNQKTLDSIYAEKRKGDIYREYEATVKDTMSYPEFVQKKILDINDSYSYKLYEIQMEIENSQAGFRNFTYNIDSPGSTITGVPSTFPKWIPEELRDKKLMEKTFEYFNKGGILPPRNTRMRELFDVYLKRLDPNLFIYEGESASALDGGGIRSKVEKDVGMGVNKIDGRNLRNEGDRSSRQNNAPDNQKGTGSPTPQGESQGKKVDDKNAYQSYVESGGIGNTEARNSEKTDAFKLAERMREIIKNLNTNYTRYVSKGSKGTFYTESGNIAITSINDVDTVHHELSHLIDIKQGITDAYENDTKIVDELTRIYLQYYPGAESGHDLDLRMKEGYAVLQQKHLTHPTRISSDYPLLVETFITNGHILQKKLNADMQKLVTDYQGLSDTDKIGAILTDVTKNTKANTFLNTFESIEQYTSDVVIPFVKLQEQAEQNVDVANLLYANKAVNGRIFKNLDRNGLNLTESVKNKGLRYDHDFWHFNEKGELEKKYDYNWGSLIWEVGQTRKMDEFSEWLIARDQVGQYERLDRMTKRLQSMEEGDDKEALMKRREEVVSYLKANEQILPRNLVERVHSAKKKEFSELAKKFDNLLRADMDYLHAVGTLSDDHYEAIKNSYGYAPIRRSLEDGIVGSNNTEIQISGFKIPKAKQLKGRDGGTMEIVNPLLGAIQNHVEAMQKGYRQMTLNRVYDLMVQFPHFAQAVDAVVSLVNGIPTYTTPQGKPLTMDENIIIKMENGAPKPMVLSGELIETIQSVFHPRPRSGIESTIVGATQIFTKGTTGLYVPFFLTNVLRDQWSAVAHTKNGYIPVYSQLKELLPIAIKREGTDYEYMKEYLALGGHQNLLKWNEATGQQILEYLTEGQKGWKNWMTWLNKGVDILAIPTNISETGTRIVEYIKARKAGKTQWEALEDAGQLTAPFHHQGRVMDSEYGRGYIRSIPFFSATIQGMSQWVRTLRTSRGQKRAGGVFLAVTASIVGSLLYIWESADEEDKKALLDMDPSQFGKFIFFPKGNGEFYRLPVPQEIGAVGALFGMIINDTYDNPKYSPKEYISTITSWIPDQLNITDPEKAVLAMIPTLLKPTAEVAFNRKTFPKVAPIEGQSMERLPSEFRYNEYTSDFAKWLGSTGLAKSMDMSPLKIDHLITGQFGRASGYITGKETALNPLISIEQGRYFTSGRMLQEYYNEKDYVSEQLTASSKGLITLSDDQIIELKARKKTLDGLYDGILEYVTEEKKGASEEVLVEMRGKIWDDVNTYFEKGVEVTPVDRLRYEKQKESDEWAAKKEELLDRMISEYHSRTGVTKGTQIAKEIKEELGGNKMDDSTKRRYNALVKDFQVLRDYKDDADVMSIAKAPSNDEKLLIFESMKQKMTSEEYQRKKLELRKNDIISDPLWKDLQKQDK